MGDLRARPSVLDLDGCPLSAYARGLGEHADRTPQEVHREALTRRGTPEHRSAWERLLILVERT